MDEEIKKMELEIEALKIAQKVPANIQFYTYETTIQNLIYTDEAYINNYLGHLTFESGSRNPTVYQVTYMAVYYDESDGTVMYYEGPQIETDSDTEKSFLFTPTFIESKSDQPTFTSYTTIKVLSSRRVTGFSYERIR